MTSTFEDQIAKLAKHITNEATKGDTPLSEATDAFKALTTYYGLLLKHREKLDPDDDEPGFADFTKGIEAAAEKANGRVRSRPGA